MAADMPNDQVVPFFDEHELRLLGVLTDRKTEYCGLREQDEYQLYLTIEDIDHSKTKVKVLKQMEYVKDSTEQYKKSFMLSLLERKYPWSINI